jgi:hypothetical protein
VFKKESDKEKAGHGPPETIKAGETGLDSSSYQPMLNCAAGAWALA